MPAARLKLYSAGGGGEKKKKYIGNGDFVRASYGDVNREGVTEMVVAKARRDESWRKYAALSSAGNQYAGGGGS